MRRPTKLFTLLSITKTSQRRRKEQALYSYVRILRDIRFAHSSGRTGVIFQNFPPFVVRSECLHERLEPYERISKSSYFYIFNIFFHSSIKHSFIKGLLAHPLLKQGANMLLDCQRLKGFRPHCLRNSDGHSPAAAVHHQA